MARPLKWRAANIRSVHHTAIITAGVIGSGGSLLNIILLTVQADGNIMQTCNFPRVIPLNSLHFLIAIKVLNLVCVYCCPCFILIAANIAILVASRKKKNCIQSNRKTRKENKMSYILSFLVFSSLFMLCCLPEPIFDLKLAIDGVSKVQANTVTERLLSMGEIVTDAVIWNLSTVAFALNTIVGMQYTSI